MNITAFNEAYKDVGGLGSYFTPYGAVLPVSRNIDLVNILNVGIPLIYNNYLNSFES